MCYEGPRGWVARRYWSRAERMESLKEYKAALEREVAGVAERLRELEEAA